MFKKIATAEDWFEAYQITDNLFVFCERRHAESTIVNLIVGEQRAALVDTGCGIGRLRPLVEQVTKKPVVVINTHTHPDHLGGNCEFDEVAMFDHPRSRRAAEIGVSPEILHEEILADNLVSGPWPSGFDPSSCSPGSFRVDRWLRDGDRVDIGGRHLEVIFTPGEAPDHICLLDEVDRILFSGDILLRGPVWTHLDGGSLNDLTASYSRLIERYDAFDHLMPSHNDFWLDKHLLPETLDGAKRVLRGEVRPIERTDRWNRRINEYSFPGFSITTRVE